MKKAIKIIVIIILLLLVSFGGFIVFMFATDYRPKAVINLNEENNKTALVEPNKIYKLTTFNIGYCGLDASENFFMDGGTSSRCKSKEQTLVNLEAIEDFLESDNADFNFIQEIDRHSSRSYNVNELADFKKRFTNYGSAFAQNYKVKWVPVPWNRPMGYVDSGIYLMSKFKINDAKRYQLPGKESALRQLFMLDRCLIKAELPVSNGKELILINLHLSAYDKGGKVRKYQIAFLKKFIKDNYKNGNYVIVGGDWNHLLSQRLLKEKKPNDIWPDWLMTLPKDFKIDDFQWGVDDSTFTVRDNRTKYIEGKSFVTIIDGFLVSPNIKIDKVKCNDLNFSYSDHNPVSMFFELK